MELRRLGHVTDKLSLENRSLLEEIKSKDNMIKSLKEETEKNKMEIKNMGLILKSLYIKIVENAVYCMQVN